MVLLRALILAVSLLVSVAERQPTDCSMLQESQLGNATAQSTAGLLAEAIAAISGDNTTSPSIQILQTNTVCLAQGRSRDTYRSVSLVVRYLETDAEYTAQVEYQCDEGEWGFGSLDPSVTMNATGTLITSLRTDCSLCYSEYLLDDLSVGSADEHCISCDEACTGLGRCSGPPNGTCCNYFDMMGSCVVNCPEGSTPNADYTCKYDMASGDVGVNDCDLDPCENGGTCTDMACACVPGYTGDNCAININDCDPDHCENGGICIDLVNAYSCACVPGFTGDNCAINTESIEVTTVIAIAVLAFTPLLVLFMGVFFSLLIVIRRRMEAKDKRQENLYSKDIQKEGRECSGS